MSLIKRYQRHHHHIQSKSYKIQLMTNKNPIRQINKFSVVFHKLRVIDHEIYHFCWTFTTPSHLPLAIPLHGGFIHCFNNSKLKYFLHFSTTFIDWFKSFSEENFLQTKHLLKINWFKFEYCVSHSKKITFQCQVLVL